MKRNLFRLVPAIALFLIIACTGVRATPTEAETAATSPPTAARDLLDVADLTPTAAEPDGKVTGLIPQSDVTEGWKEVEASGWRGQRGFALKLPQSWELRELQGIDSYVGEFVGDGARLHFDYGPFSWNLNPKDDPEHEYNVAYEKIGEVEAKFIWPTDPSVGFTAVYFSNLGGTHLNIIGERLTQKQQHTAFAIFRSVRSLD